VRGRRRRPAAAIGLLPLGTSGLYVDFWLVARLRSLIVLLLVSLFPAFAMEPAANFLASHSWQRRLATAAVFTVLIFAVVASLKSSCATVSPILRSARNHHGLDDVHRHPLGHQPGPIAVTKVMEPRPLHQARAAMWRSTSM
jgi:hypothetical protein